MSVSCRMNRMVVASAGVGMLLACAGSAVAQVSSLGARKRAEDAEKRPDVLSKELEASRKNVVYGRYSWITVDPEPPRTYKVEDLVTIIVRENRKFEADSDNNAQSDFKVESTVDAFFKPTDGGLGATTFQRGKPNVDYEWKSDAKNKGDASREDSLTMRITAKVIDVKPNGLLTLEGKLTIKHEEEVSSVTITGVCRKEDILPDNTVLSTQMAEKVIAVDNEGPVRDAAKRGWVRHLLDLIKPF